MKWIEHGVSFEGTVAEYKELHSDGFAPVLQRTRAGRGVTVDIDPVTAEFFPTIKAAAEYISQKSGRFVSPSTVARSLDENDHVDLAPFMPPGQVPLFETNSENTNEEEESNHGQN